MMTVASMLYSIESNYLDYFDDCTEVVVLFGFVFPANRFPPRTKKNAFVCAHTNNMNMRKRKKNLLLEMIKVNL